MTQLILSIPGWFVPFLIGLVSVAGLAIILERGYQLHLRLQPLNGETQGRLIQLVHGGNYDEARRLCEDVSHPVFGLTRALIDCNGTVEFEMHRIVAQLQKHLPSLGIVSTIAPLLGLLGTVSGMIKSFHAFESSGGSAAAGAGLTGGIDEALITTALGLFVAIPALVAYNYYVHRANQIADETEALGRRLAEELKQS